MTVVEVLKVTAIVVTLASYSIGLSVLNKKAQKAQIKYMDTCERISSGEQVDVTTFYRDTFGPVLREAHEFGVGELEGNLINGPILDMSFQMLEAARLLRLAKNAEEALALPNEIRAAATSLKQAGYIWVPNSNTRLGGYWRRPEGNPKNLPPPNKFYEKYVQKICNPES